MPNLLARCLLQNCVKIWATAIMMNKPNALCYRINIMAEIPDLQQRLDDLEIHITHQDSVIQELNEVTIQQWAAIEKLTGKLEFLKNKLQAAEESMESGETQEPPPPHY